MGKVFTLFVLGFFFLILGSTGISCAKTPHTKLFVFGDSYADTGNLGRLLGRQYARSWFEPYGATFPGKPTGRFSDGRVLTDFIASFMGIKSPIPYKTRKYGSTLLPFGMNFATAGSGVLDTGNFQRNLSVQIDLLQAQIDTGVFSRDDVNRSSIAFIAVSGNDYARFADLDPDYLRHIRGYMRRIFSQLRADLARLGEIGVPKVILTNLHPIECTPFFTRVTNYTVCPPAISAAVAMHNRRIHKLVRSLNRHDGGAVVLSLDVNTAFHVALRETMGRPLVPCCESISSEVNCGQVDEEGNELYSVCRRPEEHFYWDSVHPTQAGWATAFSYLKPALRLFLRAYPRRK